MSIGRHMARFAAAAIVMIAALLASSLAEAHEGRTHQHGARAVISHVAPVTAMVAPEKAAQASLAVTAVVRSTIDGPAGDDCGLGGHCCGMCTSCCHAAMPLAFTSAEAEPVTALSVVPPQQAARPGLSPETLPEPPRSFA